ncbi:MAG: hypothetical protein JRE43_07045 [Deltaproteobacteria bacterium]|jgi:hypothetical protein|nr:hypothetical protein [Deltaproteobacteria bacterium]
MEENAFTMEIIAGVIFFCVGVRLFRLSRRTRQAPEYLVALTFIAWALSFAIYDIPYLFTAEGESVAPAAAYGSLIAVNVGNIALALFTREVFRKGERWATWLVAAMVSLMLFGTAASGWSGDWEQIDPIGNPGYWPQTVGGLAPSVWMCVEGFTQHHNARKRLKLGLCSPITCHNFLLWGIAGGLWLGLEGVLVAQDHFYLEAGEWSNALGIANGLLEIVPIALMWLVFFPPAAYRRWVEGAQPA